MNNGVEEARAADVAAAPGVVPEPVCPLRDVKEPDIGPHRLAVLADLFIAEIFIKRSARRKISIKAAVFFVSDRPVLRIRIRDPVPF